MKKGIRKTISVIAILTMTFQIGMPMIPVFQTKALAADTTTVEEQNINEQTGTTEVSESTDTTETEEISRNYEIKDEETWDVSKNGDGSVIAKWTLDDRTLTISGTGEMKNWSVSSEEDWHNTQYTNVIENAIIENGITNIGENAFYECGNIKSINIPEDVTSIESFAFSGCTSLTSINIPEGVTSIGWSTFGECSGLKNITIPNSVTSIERYAFSDCSSLRNIEIPENVTQIGGGIFLRCTNLESINVSANNEDYVSEDGILFNKEKTKIISYPIGRKDIKEYEIPSTVTTLEEYAFGYSSLESIIIPEGVISIGNNAIPETTIIYTKKNTEGHRYAEESQQAYILIYEQGDINQDDKIDVTDLLMLKRHLIAENKTEWILTGRALLLADVNEDEIVDITDMLMLKKVIVEKM